MSTKVKDQEEFKLKDNSLEEDIAFIRSLKGSAPKSNLTEKERKAIRLKACLEMTEEKSKEMKAWFDSI